MSATLSYDWKVQREEVGKTIEIGFFVRNAADETEVRALCDLGSGGGGIPNPVGQYYLDHYSIEERCNETTWRVVAYYNAPTPYDEMDPDDTYEFDTTGGTQHIEQALTVIANYGSGKLTTPRGVIGYDSESGEIRGMDIVVPRYDFAERHWFYNSGMTETFKKAIADTTGKVNNATFRGFAAGEVLFLGAVGGRDGDDDGDRWNLLFKFARQPNLASFTYGGISVTSKKGWEVLNPWYKRDTAATDDGKTRKVPTVVDVTVLQVYYEADFSALDIG